MIPEFTTAPTAAVLRAMNDMVRACNQMQGLAGSAFVKVNKTGHGVNIDLNMARVIEAMPRGTKFGTYATPDEIGRTPEGAEAANADTWNRESPASGKDGVTFNVMTGVVYNHNGDEKLYGYYVLLTLDSRGMLVSKGAETRYEIDVPVACP